jgi:hypothetical protein
MLGLLFDGDDRAAGERRDVQSTDLALQSRMEQFDACDLTANCRTSKTSSGSFDFGKLRHRNASRVTGN